MGEEAREEAEPTSMSMIKKGHRIDKTGRTKDRPRFSIIKHSMMKSQAFMSLGAVERATLLMIYLRHNGSNNGQIPLSIREVAGELRIGKTTAAKAFDELQRCGFVRVAVKSSFDWKVESGEFIGRATRWRLTEEPSGPPEQRTPPTREYFTWGGPQDDYKKPIGGRKHNQKQSAVRPQVRVVPASGQNVLADGHTPIDGALSVPLAGHTTQIPQNNVPHDGQYISTINSSRRLS